MKEADLFRQYAQEAASRTRPPKQQAEKRKMPLWRLPAHGRKRL
jgi:hypothetical protein